MAQNQVEELDRQFKDINLLVSQIQKQPWAYKEQVAIKIKEMKILNNMIIQSPNQKSNEFNQLCIFISQIFQFYPNELKPIVSNLMEIYQQFQQQLNKRTSYKIIECLIIIMKKGYIDFLNSVKFFIQILQIDDKELRKLIYINLINFTKKIVKNKQFYKIESKFLLLLQDIVSQSLPILQKRIIKFVIKLYYKKIWANKKPINFIANQITNREQSISLQVAKFLIMTTEQTREEMNEDEEDDQLNIIAKEYGKKYKSSKKKIDKLERQMKNIRKKQQKQNLLQKSNFFPIDLIYSPSQFIDKCLQYLLEQKNLRYQLKIELCCLMGRLIGRNQLIYPQYYQYVQRFVRPETNNPERIFTFISESVHEQTNLEDIDQLVKLFIKHFVSETFSEEKIIVGINVLRILLIRNNNCITPNDLTYICSFRNLKSKQVVQAAKSFINTARDICPDLLDKEYKINNYQQDINQVVNRTDQIQKRIQGAELLSKNTEIECRKILTDEDFKQIKKLQRQQIANRIRNKEKIEKVYSKENDLDNLLKSKELNQNEIVRIINDKENLKYLEQIYNENKRSVKELVNNVDIQINYKYIRRTNGDKKEKERIKDYIKNKQQKQESQENEMSLSESDTENEEDIKQLKTGFLNEDLIKTFKKRKKQKTESELKEKYEKLLQRKYGYRKKMKKGSKTNQEKLKNKPLFMVLNKIKQEKRNLKEIKKKIHKNKNFLGKVSKRNKNMVKKK